LDPKEAMDLCPTKYIASVIAKLGRTPAAGQNKNQCWHVRGGIDAVRVAREASCPAPICLSDCDAECGNLRQP